MERPTFRKNRCSRRRAPQVSIGKDVDYGMGLMVDHDIRSAGRSSRRRLGRISQRHDVAARTKRGPGHPYKCRSWMAASRPHPAQVARASLRRTFLRPRRSSTPTRRVSTADLAAERKLMTIPGRCESECQARQTLRECIARRNHRQHVRSFYNLRFGEWKSEVASRKNPDGTNFLHHHCTGWVGALSLWSVRGPGER